MEHGSETIGQKFISDHLLKNKNKLLSDKYNQCISEILDAKSKEIAIKGEKADLLLKIADLEAKNQELKRQITLMELTKL